MNSILPIHLIAARTDGSSAAVQDVPEKYEKYASSL